MAETYHRSLTIHPSFSDPKSHSKIMDKIKKLNKGLNFDVFESKKLVNGHSLISIPSACSQYGWDLDFEHQNFIDQIKSFVEENDLGFTIHTEYNNDGQINGPEVISRINED